MFSDFTTCKIIKKWSWQDKYMQINAEASSDYDFNIKGMLTVLDTLVLSLFLGINEFTWFPYTFMHIYYLMPLPEKTEKFWVIKLGFTEVFNEDAFSNFTIILKCSTWKPRLTPSDAEC